MSFQVIFYCSIHMVQKWRKQIIGLIQNWNFVRQLGQIPTSKRNLGYGPEVDNKLSVNKKCEKWRRLITGRMRSQKTGSRNELVV